MIAGLTEGRRWPPRTPAKGRARSAGSIFSRIQANVTENSPDRRRADGPGGHRSHAEVRWAYGADGNEWPTGAGPPRGRRGGGPGADGSHDAGHEWLGGRAGDQEPVARLAGRGRQRDAALSPGPA